MFQRSLKHQRISSDRLRVLRVEIVADNLLQQHGVLCANPRFQNSVATHASVNGP
jgi:hypothetical protein